MDIAIIGGGASGMASAYYLSKLGHHVTVFEKQPYLGGNVRTLNKNVPANQLDPGLILEAGVIEFPDVFSHFIDLMQELGVELEPVDMGSSMFFKDGRHALSPSMIKRNFKGVRRIREYLKFAHVYLAMAGLWLKAPVQNKKSPKRQAEEHRLHDHPISDYVKQNSLGNKWLKSLIMYSYSIPFNAIGQVPAELAIPAMRDYVWADWVRIKGGVYTYIEKILAQINGDVQLNANISSITRQPNGVKIELASGHTHCFDKIVLAVPPGQILTLLSDPSEDEKKWFSCWRDNHIKTVIHTDSSIYSRYDVKTMSEFDFFESDQGWGYNCFLNQLCGLNTSTRYYLSFNLETLIDDQCIVHCQEHMTPFYTVDAFAHRDEIIRCNGKNHTYHAGAYLKDGLHEGAITSAFEVAELIGF